MQQGCKNRLLLLDDEKPRPLLGRNAVEVLGDGLVEITVLRARGRGVSLQVFAEFGHTNGHSRVAVDGRFVAQEAFLEPHLGLRAQVVMHPCKHDDDLVASVGRFTDEP
ncbi:hypothetical protein D3C78_1641710 [compost metagenome]